MLPGYCISGDIVPVSPPAPDGSTLFFAIGLILQWVANNQLDGYVDVNVERDLHIVSSFDEH